MARKKLDPLEADRRKKARAAERRRLRKLGQSASPTSHRSKRPMEKPRFPNELFDWAEDIPENPKDLNWLIVLGVKAAADRIINGARTRPFYISVHWPQGSGPEPSFDFYPCGYFRSGDRVYYSFAFPDHRDAVFRVYRKKLKAHKETRESVIKAHARAYPKK